uniref:G_PROTEIN_RECEP_F1_2 domain-containing protein n=1 Tax=Anisakis simplex TaxID=6269 RepID=A0A0M3J007_ANISI
LTCAQKAYVWFRIIGSTWPPSTQVAIGFDRVVCVFKPFWYQKFVEKRATILICRDIQFGMLSVAFVLISILVAIILVLRNGDKEVNHYCGRKATFSPEYGLFVYWTEVSMVFNQALCARSIFRTITAQLKKIRAIVVLNILSCVLVTLPNIASLLSVYFGRFPISVSETGEWLSSINSALNFFVYITMNAEFRRRVRALLCTNVKVDAVNMVQLTPAARE